MAVGTHHLTLVDFGDKAFGARPVDERRDQLVFVADMVEIHHIRGKDATTVHTRVALELGDDALVAIYPAPPATSKHCEMTLSVPGLSYQSRQTSFMHTAQYDCGLVRAESRHPNSVMRFVTPQRGHGLIAVGT